MREVQDRALAALQGIAARARPGERVAVVTHQLVISAVLTALVGEPTSAWRSRTHANTAWSEVLWGPTPELHAFRLSSPAAELSASQQKPRCPSSHT